MSSSRPQPPPQPYTALQQDRQARNRPANVHSATMATTAGGPLRGAGQRSSLARDETFEERERRYNAARILESNEMLIWHSVARNESLPQTRLHFEKIVAGFDSDDSDPEWENATPPPPPQQQQQQQQPSGSRSASGNKRDRGSNSPGSRSRNRSRAGTPA